MYYTLLECVVHQSSQVSIVDVASACFAYGRTRIEIIVIYLLVRFRSHWITFFLRYNDELCVEAGQSFGLFIPDHRFHYSIAEITEYLCEIDVALFVRISFSVEQE